MAPRLITEGEFRSSQYGQLADQIEGRLSDIIERAESHIESYVDRKLSRQTYTELAEVGQRSIFLRELPIISVAKVEMRRASSTPWVEIPATEYTVLNAIGVIDVIDVDLRDAKVRVTYDAGYDPIPAIIKAATILQTAYFGFQDFEIYGSGDGKPPGITYIQKDIYRYLEPFVRKKLV